ncbi:MAG: hypothetical protein VB050_03280 [Geobacteraceae bacterium]|nr:hypothetical protein [Geobacteraceae bacterium]
MALSFEQIRELVRSAIQAPAGEDHYCYIVEMYDDTVVYELDDKLFRRTYAIVDDQVTLGEATAVKKQVEYIPLQAAARILAAVGAPGSDEYGYQWRVQVIEYGPGADGRINWPREPLVAAISLYDGARVFALNDSQHQAGGKPFGKSVREIVGWLKNPQDTGAGIEADLFILKSAQWLRDGLVDSHERGNPGLFGLSHDVTGKAVTKMVAGKRMKEPTEITAVEVDVVYNPTNNGQFLRMAAAIQAGQEEEDMLKKLLAALQKTRPDLHLQITEGMDKGSVTADQALQMVAAATVKAAGGDETNEKLVAAITATLKETLTTGERNEVQELRLMACAMTLDRELTASKLPDAAQKTLRERFEGTTFETTELQAAIKSTKEMLDAVTGSGQVIGAGEVRAGRESGEKLQAAFDGMLGLQVAEDLRGVPAFTSLRAAYVEMTGDTDVTGVLSPQQIRRMQAAYGDTTFAYALGNTLYRRLINDYREAGDYGVSRLVGSNIRNARDFRTLEAINIGYYGDIPTLDTDTQDYPDLGEVSDEKVEYALAERGGIITINRRMIINDDLRIVQKIISRLPRAARRTLAKRVWTLFISNANYDGDAKAIFHSDHGNLGSAAYAIASALAARTAMAKQTEPGSGERLNLRPVTVAFPADLYGIVSNVNSFQPQAVTVDNGNSMFGFFRPEGLVEVPFMTDANDWMMFADPNECEIVELAFLNGQQEPQMLVADNPAVGQMFVGGRLQYRISHDYEAECTDYRGAYKAVVSG